MPDPQKWSNDLIASVSVTPYGLHVAVERAPVFKHNDPADAAAKPELLHLARRVYIQQEDLDEHGYTIPGCKKCKDLFDYGSSRAPHSDLSRKRIMEAMSQTDKGRETIAKAAAIMERSVEEATAHDDHDGDLREVHGGDVQRADAAAQGEIDGGAPGQDVLF